jgi:hypothetical protein
VRIAAQHIVLLACLILVGCQPYPDHGDLIQDFRADAVDFGTRRELKLVNSRGDEEGLVLQFNQPLQRLSELGEPVPFELDFRPRIPVEDMRREGVATVRIDFAEKLPPAHIYRAVIPPGWRALTGASLVRAQTVEWETARPALSEVDPVPGEAAWSMVFNQPIDQESLNRKLVVPGLSEEDYDIVPLDPTHYELRILTPVAVASLKLSAGLESKVGALRGVEQEFPLTGDSAGVFFCETSEWLPELGAAHFIFSEKVSRTELLHELEGMEQAAGQLYSEDGKDYILFLGDVSRARQLTISDSLTAQNGARLLQEVNLTATAIRRPAPREKHRSFQRLKPSETVLSLPTGEKTRVATWKLDRKTVVSLSRLSDAEWAEPKKLPVEYSAPVYKHETKKARKRTRFLKNEAEPSGHFLVRIATGKKVQRLLLSRSELMLEGWSLNGMAKGFAARLNGIPLSDVAIELCDSSGEVVDVVSSAPDGTAEFGKNEHRGAYLWASESLGAALVPVVHQQVPPPVATPGLLWTHGKFFEPGQDSTYIGLWWSEGKLPLVEVVDGGGELVGVSISPPELVGPFYQGRFAAPQLSGEYRLRFRRGTGSHESALVRTSTFYVSRLAGLSGAADVVLNLSELESGEYGGNYEWQGRGASALGLRARLVAQQSTRDGWEQIRPGTPDLIPVGLETNVSMSGGDYQLEKLPPIQGRWNLSVEMFDSESPGTVVQEAVVELGKEEVELLDCELKPLSPTTTLARFRLEFTRFEENGRRALFCRLDTKQDGFWIPQPSSEAVPEAGVYGWDVSVPANGTYRLHVLDELQGESLAVWQTSLRGSGTATSELEITPQPVSPGRRLTVDWPQLEEGTPVWLSLLTGNQQTTQRRVADQEGGMGEVIVPEMGLGQRELEVVLASLSPELRLQVDSVEVDTSTLFQSIDAELISEGPLVIPDQILQLQLPEPFRLGVAWWSHAEIETEDGLEGLPEAIDFVQTGQELANLPIVGPADFSESEKLAISAPPVPGRYDLRLLGVSEDGIMLFCRQSVEVQAEARWEPVTPDWLRPGDAFAAGVRFWSDPEEVASTGATTSIEDESNLLPLSYLATAALVKPGSVGDMLFSYQAPEFAADSDASKINLVWELGVEGEAHRVEAALAPLPTPVSIESFRDLILNPGRRRRLSVPFPGHWLVRVSLEEDEPAVVSMASQQLAEMEVNLSKLSGKEFAGNGADTLEAELLSGPPVKLEILELKPISIEYSYSAKGLYLVRQLENLEGKRIESDDAEIGQSYLLAHHLVVPTAGQAGELSVPLPGGTRGKGVWVREGEKLTALRWQVDEGTIRATLPELSEGEHEIVVLVDAHVGGDYFWPGSEVIGTDDEVRSSTVSERVKIDWE